MYFPLNTALYGPPQPPPPLSSLEEKDSSGSESDSVGFNTGWSHTKHISIINLGLFDVDCFLCRQSIPIHLSHRRHLVSSLSHLIKTKV